MFLRASLFHCPVNFCGGIAPASTLGDTELEDFTAMVFDALCHLERAAVFDFADHFE
jgi:hypothetical protein